MRNLFVSLLLLVLFSSLTHAQNSQFINYPAPEGAEPANDFELEINGQKVFVYNTRSAAYAYFSFEGKLDITVKPGAFIYSYDIRPASRKIAASIYRNEIHFSISEPMQISVEVNKNVKRPLFIFANALEKNPPSKTAKDVLFFEAGKIHNAGKVQLKSNQTVYIEGGAIVRGSFNLENVHNAKITGRGIIDNSRYIKAEARPVAITHCDDVLIEGVIIAESRHWSAGSYGSTNIRYHNMKVVSDNDWDDGIDIVASSHIQIENCFIRSKDDCIAIKSGVDYFGKADHINVNDVVVNNCVFWNGVWGNALEIGFETSTDTIQNIRFMNSDIIHTEGPEGTFTIHNGDHATVKNVLYENINVEDVQGYLIDFKILFSQYSTDKERGKISDVYFKNINVEGERFPSSLLLGFDKDYRINNITLDNLFIHGKHITNAYAAMLTSVFADNIVYK
jgi:polygalacturonase